MDDLPPWEDDPMVTVVCPYCFLKHEPGVCYVQQLSLTMLASLDEDGAAERTKDGLGS